MQLLFCGLYFVIRYALGYTLVPSSAPFVEDWNFRATHNDVSTEEDPGWWFHGGGETYLNATGTSPMDGQVWGWWTSVDGDPANQVSRYFKCASYSLVTITFKVYFCVQNSYSGYAQDFYYRRTGGVNGDGSRERLIELGFAEILNQNTSHLRDDAYGDYGMYEYEASRGSSPAGTTCGGNIWRATAIDTFHTDAAPVDLITVTLSKWLYGNAVDYRQQAWNGFEMTCTTDPTDAPTLSPSSATGAPSNAPIKTPTVSPSDTPSESPTPSPSKAPQTMSPSGVPTSVAPTQAPSKTPTASPSNSPTKNPSKAPTPRPTDIPSVAPSVQEEEERSFGRLLSDAAGTTGNQECDDDMSWVECNQLIGMLLLALFVLLCCWCIAGFVCFTKRQRNRPKPASWMNQDVQQIEVPATSPKHATSDKWMSSWEREQAAARGE